VSVVPLVGDVVSVTVPTTGSVVELTASPLVDVVSVTVSTTGSVVELVTVVSETVGVDDAPLGGSATVPAAPLVKSVVEVVDG
jgi:hypothetical protein